MIELKKLFVLGAVLCALLTTTGCLMGPKNMIQPLFHPGVPVMMKGVTATFSMSGSGNMTIQEIIILSTNSTVGWPEDATNSITATPVDSGLLIRR